MRTSGRASIRSLPFDSSRPDPSEAALLHTDAAFSDAVQAAVERAEAHTDAELVVVAAARSGSYWDVSLLCAGVGGLLALMGVLYSPIVVHPAWVPADMLVGAALFAFFARSRFVLHRLVPRKRQQRHVLAAAREAFVAEAVHATPQRTGVMIYLSALEEQVVCVADVGIEGVMPLGEWRPATESLSATDLDAFCRGLEALGELLGQHLPPTKDPNRIALSDAPRVRP